MERSKSILVLYLRGETSSAASIALLKVIEGYFGYGVGICLHFLMYLQMVHKSLKSCTFILPLPLILFGQFPNSLEVRHQWLLLPNLWPEAVRLFGLWSGYLFTFPDVPSDGAQSCKIMHIYIAPSLILMGLFHSFLEVRLKHRTENRTMNSFSTVSQLSKATGHLPCTVLSSPITHLVIMSEILLNMLHGLCQVVI
jgi:hypothetical protein